MVKAQPFAAHDVDGRQYGLTAHILFLLELLHRRQGLSLLAFGDQLWLATRRFAKRLIRNDATATTIMAPVIAPMMPPQSNLFVSARLPYMPVIQSCRRVGGGRVSPGVKIAQSADLGTVMIYFGERARDE